MAWIQDCKVEHSTLCFRLELNTHFLYILFLDSRLYSRHRSGHKIPPFPQLSVLPTSIVVSSTHTYLSFRSVRSSLLDITLSGEDVDVDLESSVNVPVNSIGQPY